MKSRVILALMLLLLAVQTMAVAIADPAPERQAPFVGKFDYGWARCGSVVWGYSNDSTALDVGANQTYNVGCGISIENAGHWPVPSNPEPSAVCGGTDNRVPVMDHGYEYFNTKGASIKYFYRTTDNPPCGSNSTDGLTIYRQRPVACPPGWVWVDTVPALCEKVKTPPCDCNGQGGINPSNPIDTAQGTKLQKETDITAGKGLTFIRYYSSYPSWMTATLGANWRHNFEIGLTVVPWPDGSGTTVWAQRASGELDWFNVTSAGVITHQPNVMLDLSRQTDAGGNVAGWTIRDEAGETETYSADGYVQQMTRNKVDVLTFDYVDGRLNAVIDANGRSLVFTYDASHRLGSVTGPDGGTVTYGYDANNNLVSATYPDATPAIQTDNPKRAYFYKYTDNGALLHALTGLNDENKQRYATWDYTYFYDFSLGNFVPQGTLSTHGSGQDKVTFVYNSDGTRTVTTGLGQKITYSFTSVFGDPKYSSMSAKCVLCGHPYAGTTYDANGFVQTTTDFGTTGSTPTVTSYVHDPATGLETSRIDSSNHPATLRTTATDWNAQFRAPTEVRVTDASGTLARKTNSTYNARGQVTFRCIADPAVTGATSYACGAQAHAPDGVRQWGYAYCEAADVAAPNSTCPLLGLLKTVTGPRTDTTDNVTTYTYFGSDDPACATGPTTCLHRKGDLASISNPLHQIESFTKYDGAGRLLSSIDRNGVVTDLTFNARGWLTQRAVRGTNNSVTTDDAITKYDFDNVGQLTGLTRPNGAHITFTYDAAHRLTDVADSVGNSIHYTLNNFGQRTAEATKDPTGTLKRNVLRVFNKLGQLSTVQNADGATNASYTYDGNGKRDLVTDGRGTITDNDYDALNRLSHVLQDKGTGHIQANTNYGYDALDHLTDVQDPQGLHTTYTYDGLDNLKRLGSPDTGATNSTYDSAGKLKTRTDARGVTATYTYDGLDRVTSVTYPTTGLNQTFTYDVTTTGASGCSAGQTFGIGHLSQVTDASGTIQLCYDRFGNLVRRKQTTGVRSFTTNYAYDLAGKLTQLTTPKSTVVTYGRDAAGRIGSVSYRLAGGSDTTLVSAVTYYPFGPVASITYGNGRVLTRSFDQDYVVAGVSDPSAGGLDLAYGRDVLGNLTQIANAALTSGNKFTYDRLNRLTEVDDLNNALVAAYTYDNTGNRKSKRVGGSTEVYTYPLDSHHLVDVAGTARTYDADGNTKTIGVGGTAKGFLYDDTGRMNEYDAGGALRKSYSVNGLGERVRKYRGNLAAENQYTAYDGSGHVLGDYDNAAARIRELVWMDDLPVGVFDAAGSVAYIEPDHLGTPRVAIDATRNVAIWKWPILNDAFGESPPNQDPDANAVNYVFNLRLPGQVWDLESGLSYNYFRDYDSSVGRYVESDPVGLRAGTSTYSYVRGRPLESTDMFGLAACEKCPYTGRYELCCNGWSADATWLGNWLRYKVCAWAVDKSCGVPGANQTVCCQSDYKACTEGGDLMACQTEYATCMSGK